MITAFLDESGTHEKQSSVTVLGGYCAGTEQWKKFEKDWTNAHGDVVFHSKEFARRPTSERDAFVTKSFEILQQNGIFRNICYGFEGRLSCFASSRYAVI